MGRVFGGPDGRTSGFYLAGGTPDPQLRPPTLEQAKVESRADGGTGVWGFAAASEFIAVIDGRGGL